MTLVDVIVNLTEKLFYVVVPEILFLLFIEKHGSRFKLRFGNKIEGHPNLKPFVNTYTVAIVFILIAIFAGDIISAMLGQKLAVWLTSLGGKLSLLTLPMLGTVFLGVYNYILEKKWDNISWGVAVGTVLCFAIFLSIVFSV